MFVVIYSVGRRSIELCMQIYVINASRVCIVNNEMFRDNNEIFWQVGGPFSKQNNKTRQRKCNIFERIFVPI